MLTKMEFRKELHRAGIKTYFNKKTKASYIKQNDLKKAMATTTIEIAFRTFVEEVSEEVEEQLKFGSSMPRRGTPIGEFRYILDIDSQNVSQYALISYFPDDDTVKYGGLYEAKEGLSELGRPVLVDRTQLKGTPAIEDWGDHDQKNREDVVKNMAAEIVEDIEIVISWQEDEEEE